MKVENAIYFEKNINKSICKQSYIGQLSSPFSEKELFS